jgi:UDPglucose--hexose-1-phosphate uridylyltransferase
MNWTSHTDLVQRTELAMNDGRQIFYYDSSSIERNARDQRPYETRPLPGELRVDLLTGESVAIASHRQARAFLPPKEFCPLCPTKTDFGTEIAETSFEVVVFENRSPSFAAPSESLPPEVVQASGRCEVVVFSDQHEGSFGTLPLSQMRTVLAAWMDRTREISQLTYVEQIYVFENRGEEVGVTLNHPHGQIYSYPFITPRTEKMLSVAEAHFAKNNEPLLTTIIAREIADGIRIISENEHWVAYVPYAARYPFEIHVAPKVFVPDLAELSEEVADAFPAIAKEVLLRLDGVFGMQMAYIASWHQAPVRIGRHLLGLHWQIASVRRAPGKLKYLSGSESAMGAFIMDLKPEQSAEQLRDVQL